MKLLIFLCLAVVLTVVNSQRYSPYYGRDSKDMKKREVYDVYGQHELYDDRGAKKREVSAYAYGFSDDDDEPELKDNAKRQLSYGYASYDQDLDSSKDEKREADDYDEPEFESQNLIKRKKRQAYDDEGYYAQRDFETDDSDVQKRDYNNDFEADFEAKDAQKREAYDNDFSDFEAQDVLKRKKRQAYDEEGYYDKRDFENDDSDVQKRDYDNDFEADLEAKDAEKREVYDNDFSDFEAQDVLKRKKRQDYGNVYYETKDMKKRQSGYNYEDLAAKEVDKRWLYW